MRLSGTKTGAVNQYRGLGNQLWDLAGNRPSLDLPFSDTKSLVDTTTGKTFVDHTRASSGTYVGSDGLIKTATTNVPRFDHDPTTGESLGLLVEESRTNLLLKSEEFDDASWVRATGTVTPNAIIAPDGTLTADYYYGDGASVGYLAKVFSFTSGVTYTYSVYAKKANTSSFTALLYGTQFDAAPNVNTSATFNFDTESVAYVGGNITGSMTSVGNGWYRCTATVTAIATGNQAQQLVRLIGVNGDVYLWGAQLEEGSFPTSYIPTEGSAVTRAADVASISGSNFSSWYRQDEGTLFAEFNRPVTVAGLRSIAATSDGSYSNRTTLRTDSPTVLTTFIITDGINTATFPQTLNSGAKNKTVIACATDNTNTATNGTLKNTDTTVDLPTANRLSIGSVLNAEISCSHVSRLTYWPTRLPNETLSTITQ